jgi:adenosylcobinamide-GDP ribazoletransferase
MPDAVRLALGTLTVLRVPAPRRVDRATARGAMLLAPLVGLLLGLAAAAVLDGVRLLPLGDAQPAAADLLGAALALALLAWLTRGLHLDGLADTADGLGVKGDGGEARERRLAAMRAPDVGAFGVVAVVLVLLVQTAAVTACALTGRGTVGLLLAAAVSRLAITWCCTPRVPSARPDGLGSAVARSVPTAAAAAATAVVLAGAVVLGVLDDDATRIDLAVPTSLVADLVLAALVGLAAGWLLRRRAVARLGGITGDVLGAVSEIAFTATLVALALLA